MENYLIFLTLLLLVNVSEIVKTAIKVKAKSGNNHKKRRTSRHNRKPRK